MNAYEAVSAIAKGSTCDNVVRHIDANFRQHEARLQWINVVGGAYVFAIAEHSVFLDEIERLDKFVRVTCNAHRSVQEAQTCQ